MFSYLSMRSRQLSDLETIMRNTGWTLSVYYVDAESPLRFPPVVVSAAGARVAAVLSIPAQS